MSRDDRDDDDSQDYYGNATTMRFWTYGLPASRAPLRPLRMPRHAQA